MEHDGARGPRELSGAARLGAAGGTGVAGAVAIAAAGPLWIAPLAGWVAAATTFLVLTWRELWPMEPAQAGVRARREEPGRLSREAMLLASSVASLGAVGIVLVRSGSAASAQRTILVGVCVASIVLSWSLVHTVYTLRYARLYYQDRPGGVDFNQDESPSYVDFAYLSLTIGMTFQVSDTDLQSRAVRRTALGHALLSYMFGALIIATTVNLIAGLSK